MTRFEISHLLTSTLVELENTDVPPRELHVHQALIDESCHPLCENLREYWKVFDGETVGRFAQYLYQADCGYPVPLPVEKVPGVTAPIGAAAPGGVSSPSDGPRNIAASASDGIKELFRGILSPLRPLTPLESFKIPELHIPQECSSPAWPVKPAGRDYEAVLLAHAKLYILSYSQGIYALSDLCISRLHRELIEINSSLNDTRILGNVVELLRYTYCSPRDVASPQPLQPAWAELQNLASQFCALKIDVIGGNREFKMLLQEGGALATDVVAKTIRRLGSAEAALKKAKKATAADKIAMAKANAAAGAAEAALAKAMKPATVEPVTLLGQFEGFRWANTPASGELSSISKVLERP